MPQLIYRIFLLFSPILMEALGKISPACAPDYPACVLKVSRRERKAKVRALPPRVRFGRSLSSCQPSSGADCTTRHILWPFSFFLSIALSLAKSFLFYQNLNFIVKTTL